MKELIKPNLIESQTNSINLKCGEQSVSGECGKLTCFCKHVGSSNDSIEDDTDILF